MPVARRIFPVDEEKGPVAALLPVEEVEEDEMTGLGGLGPGAEEDESTVDDDDPSPMGLSTGPKVVRCEQRQRKVGSTPERPVNLTQPAVDQLPAETLKN